MENKPSDVFGDHSQKAHDQCEKVFGKYQHCMKFTKYPSDCKKENSDLMQCLEDKEPTHHACITPINVYRECWVRYNPEYCWFELRALKECKKNPRSFENTHLYRFPGTSRSPLQRL